MAANDIIALPSFSF